MNTPFTFNKARFAHETVDGETMILDTVGGQLLLLTGTAPLLLDLLATGVVPAQLVGKVADRYGPDSAAHAHGFIEKMTAIGVIVPAEQSAVADAAIDVDWPGDFAAPAFESYDDIADIITMDPIHEVDAAVGWPRPSPAPHA